MKPGVPVAAPDEPLAGAAARMRSRRAGALVVLEAGRLAGIITERDLLGAMADGLDPGVTPVSDCMTPEPCTIAAADPAEEAAERMIERGIRHLPVLDEGRVVGVVSARDLLQVRRRELEGLFSEPW